MIAVCRNNHPKPAPGLCVQCRQENKERAYLKAQHAPRAEPVLDMNGRIQQLRETIGRTKSKKTKRAMRLGLLRLLKWRAGL